MNGGLVLLSLSGQTVWQRPKARVHSVTEPWPSLSILAFSFFPLLLPLPPLSPSVIHFSFFNFLLSHTFISVFIFSASPRLLFFLFPFLHPVCLSLPSFSRRAAPKLRTCLCKSYKSQSCCVSLPLPLLSLTLSLCVFVH